MIEQQLYFAGRYELQRGPAVHKTATSLVVFAKHHAMEKEERHAFDWVNQGPRALIGFGLVVVLVLGVLSLREWSQRRASVPRIQSGETVQRRDPVRVLSEAESAIRAETPVTERE